MSSDPSVVPDHSVVQDDLDDRTAVLALLFLIIPATTSSPAGAAPGRAGSGGGAPQALAGPEVDIAEVIRGAAAGAAAPSREFDVRPDPDVGCSTRLISLGSIGRR